MTIDPPATLGVILAGGLARRMGGGDKSMRLIGGRTLLESVIARLAPQCDALVLNANGNAARFDAFDLPVIADTVQGFAGPLAGILAGLDWAAANKPDAEWIVSAAADTPFLPRDLVVRLHEAQRERNAPIAVAASSNQPHHVIALWSIRLRDDIHRALTQDDVRGVGRFMARYAPAMASWPSETFDPFFNVNTIEDLAEAERIAALDGG